MTAFFVCTAFSQARAPEGVTVIEEQPEGNLRIYARAGRTIKEIVEEDDSHYITEGAPQDGMMNIVYAENRVVYIQRPVSESYYEGWVKGTLSADGHTITVPVGQYTAYTKSFDMAVQVWMMCYDTEQETYVVDESVTDIVYTVSDDGVITLQGTDYNHILSCVNRAFGDTFSYLDFEWHDIGDFESVYTPNQEALPTPPDGLQTQTLIATTGCYDGLGWDAYNSEVQLGFDGDDVWLQGFTDLLPKSWVKGHRDGNTLTFPTGQILGSYFGYMVYMVGSKPDESGNPVTTDIVFTYDGNGTYTSYTDAFVSTVKDDIQFVVYYMGMTLSETAEQPSVVPQNIKTEEYYLTYQEPDDKGLLIVKEDKVRVGIDSETSTLYILGITPLLPESCIAGAIGANGTVTFTTPQYLDTYNDEETGKFPIYFLAYNGNTGELLPSITFNYDSTTKVLKSPTATIGIGINKTGLLDIQDMYYAVFTPVNSSGIDVVTDCHPDACVIYDLHGRPVGNGSLPKGIYIKNGKKFVR